MLFLQQKAIPCSPACALWVAWFRLFKPGLPAAFLLLLFVIAPLNMHGQTGVVNGTGPNVGSNALDRINFGDTSTDAYSESAHSFVNLGQPTGTGALGRTYREIASSDNPANAGNDADNEYLTFTMACSPTLQNYLTIQIWGADTIADDIYLYNSTQGFVVGNYFGTNNPEIDDQDSNSDPLLAGRWVYETATIPLSMTTGKTSVTLLLDAANLASGQTSRPIYSAFTHTNPYFIVAPTDPQGTVPAATSPAPSVYNSAYFASILSNISNFVSGIETNQYYGANWNAAVTAGTVPQQIIGSFMTGAKPTDPNTLTEWLNNAAVFAGGPNSGNNLPMQEVEMLAFAYTTPNFLSTTYYQNTAMVGPIVAALDSFSYMQASNGCYGDMYQWDGLVQNGSTFTTQGRVAAQCSPIEGQGDWAIGATIVEMQNDSTFLSDLNQPISSTIEPGVLRYQAYQTMLTNLITALIDNHGHAPNQDMLAAKAYLWATLALRVLDKIYNTSLARSNAQMYTDYLNETVGLAPIANIANNGYWVSQGGLGLERNGTFNGGYDGGYGLVDVGYLSWLAKILNDYGIETSASHPVRTVALNASYAFSNFLYPSLVAVDSSTGYESTFRSEQALTFRNNGNVGPINMLSQYWDAAEFNDPYSLHGFYLEAANGVTWAYQTGDDGIEAEMHQYADYVTLCNMYNTNPTDPSGVTFLNEPAHGNGVWADPTGSTIAIQNNGEAIRMVLDWRPDEIYNGSITLSPTEPADNIVRIHDTTATMDRIATVMMPSSAATGASGNYKSGATDTLYVARYGNYLVGLNWQSAATTMTLPPDMQTTGGTATDLVSGANYNLSTTTTVPVPAAGAAALYQSLPTSTLSSAALNYGSVSPGSSTPITVSLANGGTGPLLIGATTITGTNSSDFSYTTTCPATLAASSHCSYTITFTPTASGTRTATFSLTTCLSTTPQTISLTGNVNASTLTVTATNLSRPFDTPNPTLTYTMTGFVGSDTQANSTSGAPLLNASAVRLSSAGGYPISITAGTLTSTKYFFQFVNGTLTVTGNAPQQIVFPPLATLATVSTLRLAAAASSGLPVTFIVASGPATISGSLLTATGTGTVTVTANQSGNSTYSAAPGVTRNLSVQ